MQVGLFLGIIIFFQAYVAIFLRGVINVRPDIVALLREVRFFWCVNVYFFVDCKGKIKKSKDQEKQSKETFFLGMLLCLNFFPIPYYVFVSITLLYDDFFSFELILT
jgi:hypothetical protein